MLVPATCQFQAFHSSTRDVDTGDCITREESASAPGRSIGHVSTGHRPAFGSNIHSLSSEHRISDA
eukprot:3698956-Rhodomonas_salina.2